MLVDSEHEKPLDPVFALEEYQENTLLARQILCMIEEEISAHGAEWPKHIPYATKSLGELLVPLARHFASIGHDVAERTTRWAKERSR